MTNTIRKDAFASYLNLFLSILAGFIAVPIIESSIGKSYFGIYQFVFSLTAYSEIMNIGLVKTVERFVAKYSMEGNHTEENTVVSLVFSIYIITCSIFFTGAGFVYWKFGQFFNFSGIELEIAKTCFLIASLNAGLNIPASVFQSFLRGKGRYTFVFNIGTIQVISKIILVITSLNLGFNVVSLFVIDMLLFQSANLIYFLTAIRKYQVRLKLFQGDRAILASIFGFTTFVFLGAIGDAFFWNTDNIILGIFTNADKIAEYALSQRLINYFYRYATAFSGLFLPRFMEYYVTDEQQSRQKMIELFTQGSHIQTMLVSFAVVNFLILGRDFIKLWVGPSYDITYYYTIVILIPFWFVLSEATGLEILYVMNRHRFIAVVYLINASLNVISSIILVQTMGPMGAAVSTAVSKVIGSFIIVNLYYRHLLQMDMLQYFKAVFGKNMIVSAIMLLYGWALNSWFSGESLYRFVIKATGVNIIFLPLIFFILLNSNQRQKIIEVLRRRRFFR